MFRFLLIPNNNGQMVTSLLPYRDLATASGTACALAQRIVNEPIYGPLQCYRPELAELVGGRPQEIEVVVINVEREAVFNALVACRQDGAE